MTKETYKDTQECQNKIETVIEEITNRQGNLIKSIETYKHNYLSSLASLEKQKRANSKKIIDLVQENKELLLIKENLTERQLSREEELKTVYQQNEKISNDNATLKALYNKKNKIMQDLKIEKKNLSQQVVDGDSIRKEKERKYYNRADILRKAINCDIITVRKDVLKFTFGAQYFVMDLTRKESIVECHPHKKDIKRYNDKYNEINNMYHFILWMRKQLG